MQISRKLFQKISFCDVFILIIAIFEYISRGSEIFNNYFIAMSVSMSNVNLYSALTSKPLMR